MPKLGVASAYTEVRPRTAVAVSPVAKMRAELAGCLERVVGLTLVIAVPPAVVLSVFISVVIVIVIVTVTVRRRQRYGGCCGVTN